MNTSIYQTLSGHKVVITELDNRSSYKYKVETFSRLTHIQPCTFTNDLLSIAVIGANHESELNNALSHIN